MIDFWISIGSTYSYLSAMRLRGVEDESGVAFRWRPFSVRAIMIEQKNIPLVGKPVKLAYMWRDIERRARSRGLEPRLPAPCPLAEFDLANRIAIVGEGEGWCADYVAPPIGIGSTPATNRVRSPVFPTPCERSVRAPPGSLNRPRARRSASRRPKRPSRSACSARRPSSSTAKCFGETTASTTRFVGARTAAPSSISTMGLPILNRRP